MNVAGIITTSKILVKTVQGSVVIGTTMDQPIATFYDNRTSYFYDDITVSGNIYANNMNPFYCAGKFNGNDLNIINNIGRKSYSITRPTGYPTGVYYIKFIDAYINADYIISITNESAARCKIWDVIRPTTNGFYIIVVNGLIILENAIVHFTVFTG